MDLFDVLSCILDLSDLISLYNEAEAKELKEEFGVHVTSVENIDKYTIISCKVKNDLIFWLNIVLPCGHLKQVNETKYEWIINAEMEHLLFENKDVVGFKRLSKESLTNYPSFTMKSQSEVSLKIILLKGENENRQLKIQYGINLKIYNEKCEIIDLDIGKVVKF